MTGSSELAGSVHHADGSETHAISRCKWRPCDAMTSPMNQRYKDALRLPEQERATLGRWLIDSLDQGSDDDAQAAWDREIQQRISDLDSGAARTVPWDVVRRTILGLP